LSAVAQRAKAEAIHTFFAAWIASRSRSSGARLRDPVARNDGDAYLAFADFRFRK
jgi:hypothetical protein